MSEQSAGGEIRRLVIVGGGSAGWMSAAFLSRLLPPERLQITLVESSEIPTVGVGEATIPPIVQFNQMMGVEEGAFLRATQGTFKLGIEFVGWTRPGEAYMHPFGAPGRPINGVSLHAWWLKARQAGLETDLFDLWIAQVAAKAGRFDFPSTDPRSPRSSLAYAYHFDAGLYAAFLADTAMGRGVERIDGVVEGVELDPADGGIARLQLKDGRTVEGDFFLDCSGFRALLLGGALGVEFEDWSHWLPADRALAVPTAAAGRLRPYTQTIAQDGGWRWNIPLQHRTGNGLVYSSAFLDDAAAERTLLAGLEGEQLAEPRMIRFQTGKRRATRHKNCLAVGLSSSFLEPLESTSLHLVQYALLKFAATFPSRRDDPLATDLYNRIYDSELAQIRDFLIFHYHANSRVGEALWDHARHMPIPDSLAEKIALFQDRGLCIFPGETLFQEPNWLAVMWGQGLRPRRWDPLADAMPTPDVVAGLRGVAASIAAAAQQMPEHAAVIRQILAQEKA